VGGVMAKKLVREVKMVPIGKLKPHPKNYRDHPDDQLDHITKSIEDHGLYRNIVVANDMTILAGHGVVKAATKKGIKEVPVVQLDIGPNDPAALRLLAGDNEIGKLALVDDRALTEMLKEIKDSGDGALLGTGYDESMLAALVMVTRPASEIASMDEAAEWVGMPEYQAEDLPFRLMVLFGSNEDREAFLSHIGADDKTVVSRRASIWSVQWPLKDSRDDWRNVKFESQE